VYPVNVGSLTEEQSLRLIAQLFSVPAKEQLGALNKSERQLIAQRCLRVPLAIEWVIARAGSPAEVLELSLELERYNSSSDVLLEFCFRRIYAALGKPLQAVLDAIAIFESPQPVEALAAASELSVLETMDAVEELRLSNLLIELQSEAILGAKVYDANTLVNRFAYANLGSRHGAETAVRRRLSSWYDAMDIQDPDERLVVSEIRKGNREPEKIFTDLGIQLRRQGKYDAADRCFKTAIERNPNSWRAYRERGELFREQRHIRTALEMYESASRYAPKKGPDRALIYREWGMLIRQSGLPDANERAAEKLEVAYKELPNDRICAVALAQVHERLGHWKRVKELLEPLVNHQDPGTRNRAGTLLLRAYEATNEIVKAAEIRKLLG